MTSSPREAVLCHYHYDPLDRLISHALSDVPERQRFYCKSRLATEIQGAMRFSIVQHGDQLLAQQRSEGDAPDTTLLATDQQRSVLQTVKANHPPQPIAYSPYGHLPSESGLLSLLGFNGERPDPVTGHYLLGNGYRAFNPALMRFNSPDKLSPFGKGGLNPYVYCLGDPVNLIDPNGTAPIEAWLRAFFTGKVKLGGGTPAKIQQGVSTRKAMQKRDRLFQLEGNIDNLQNQLNAKYQHDMANPDKFLSRIITSGSKTLNKKAASYMLEQANDGIDVPGSQHSWFTTEGMMGLEDLAEGKHATEQIEQHQRIAENFAKHYIQEMKPGANAILILESEQKSIREKYFIHY